MHLRLEILPLPPLRNYLGFIQVEFSYQFRFFLLHITHVYYILHFMSVWNGWITFLTDESVCKGSKSSRIYYINPQYLHKLENMSLDLVQSKDIEWPGLACRANLTDQIRSNGSKDNIGNVQVPNSTLQMCNNFSMKLGT
jgi:hypothetical protein